MMASLYQSGSIDVSFGSCAMRLTFDLQSAARNQLFIVARASSASALFRTKAATLPWPLSRSLCCLILLSLDLHYVARNALPLTARCIQVSVKRNARSNGLPSLVVP